jgi:hypothetical protein
LGPAWSCGTLSSKLLPSGICRGQHCCESYSAS